MTTFLSKYSLKIPVSRLVSFSKRVCLYMRSFRSIKCKVKKRKNAKKNEDNCPAILTEQAWLIKDLLYAKKENFFLQSSTGNPGLAHSSSQSERKICFTLPARGQWRIQPHNKIKYSRGAPD